MAVLIDATSFLASAALIWRIGLPAKGTGLEISEADAAEPDPAAPSFRRELKQGWDFVSHDPIMRASLAGTTTINFFTFLTGTSLIVLVATRALGGALPGAVRAHRGGRRPDRAARRGPGRRGVLRRSRGEALRRESERDPGRGGAGRHARA